MPNDQPRLIEVAFPLKQAHRTRCMRRTCVTAIFSTLHIWLARRPLAAPRATLIAAPLDEPSVFEAAEG